MSQLPRLTLLACLVASLVACSSDDSDNNSDTTAPDNTIDQNANDDSGTNTPGADNDDSANTPDADGDDNSPVNDGNQPPDYGDLPDPIIPELDPLAEPIPAPDSTDPFGSALEQDNEAATAGGPPTQPKNLRADLISNNWAELNWAPSNDDGSVVAYKINRSDGHTYLVEQDKTSSNAGAQLELNKQWATTTFIDCNFTRFLDRVYDCGIHGPRSGDIFTYEVVAVDNEGQESQPSDAITIHFHQDQGAPVPLYEDRYLDDSEFAQKHDLTNPAYFLDKFTLVFEDEFDGNSINESLWNTQLVWGDETIINDEQQYFVNTQKYPDFGYDPFKLEDSVLTIEAIPTPESLAAQLPDACATFTNPNRPACQFLSGALSTHDKFNMTFGYVEARLKASGQHGALSSFYLYHRYAGEDLERHAPEIDIVEYLGENPFGDEEAFQTYHFADVNTGITRSSPTMSVANPDGSLYSEDFHTYGVLWEPQLIIWYIDGTEIKRLSGSQVSARAMNIVTYLVAGSNWAPSPDLQQPFPLSLEIDYIRAYQRGPYVPAAQR